MRGSVVSLRRVLVAAVLRFCGADYDQSGYRLGTFRDPQKR